MTRSEGRTPGRNTGKQKSKTPLILLLLVGAGLITLALIFALQKPEPVTETQTGGSPALKVDKYEVDFGDVPVNTPVQAAFELTNTGTQPIQFTEAPYIEVVEGC